MILILTESQELGGLVIEESRVDMENLLVEICSQVCKMDGNLELAAMDDFEFHICHVNPEAQQMMAVGSVLLEGTNLTK